MALTFLRTLLNRHAKATGRQQAHKARRVYRQPWFELLEDRMLFAGNIFAWTGAVSSAWNVGGNWAAVSGPGGETFPNASDDTAQFLTGASTTSVTVPTAITVGSI